MKKIIPVFFLALSLIVPAFAESIAIPSFEMPSTASNGFGGHHVASTDNSFSLIVNPAAMARTRASSYLTLGASLFSPETLLSVANMDIPTIIDGIINEDFSVLSDPLNALAEKGGKVLLGLDMPQLPLSLAWVYNGFGLGIWNRSYVGVKLDELNVSVEAYADVMVPIGFGFEFFNAGSHSLAAGVTLKPFARVMGNLDTTITGLTGNSEELLDTINLPLIVGGSANIGLLYRWTDLGLRFGATYNDAISYGKAVYNVNSMIDGTPYIEDPNEYYIPATLNFGAAWDIQLGRFLGITLMADWVDFANYFEQDDYLNHRNYLLDLSAGVEVSLFGFLKARAGIREMLPAVGAGLKLGPLCIDAAYYGRELGYEPGQFPTAAADVSISLRF